MEKKEKVISCVMQHCGETLYLADWCCEINQQLKKSKRMTSRELASVFRTLKSDFVIERQSFPVTYSFSPL